MGLQLEVLVAGRADTPVLNEYAVPDAKLALVRRGSALPVKVDLQNSQLVAVDWDAVT